MCAGGEYNIYVYAEVSAACVCRGEGNIYVCAEVSTACVCRLWTECVQGIDAKHLYRGGVQGVCAGEEHRGAMASSILLVS